MGKHSGMEKAYEFLLALFLQKISVRRRVAVLSCGAPRGAPCGGICHVGSALWAALCGATKATGPTG
eukprot:gene9368-biopygen4595